MKILCVEDGSVDIDNLEENGLQDGGILVYRQGAEKPYVLEIDDDFNKMKKYIFERIANNQHLNGRDGITFESFYRIGERELREILYGENKGGNYENR